MKTKIIKRDKFLRTGLKSENGNIKWKVGQWKKFNGELKMCEAGFHCSVEPYDAFSFVQGEWLTEVEVRGESIKDENKQVWSEMRIVEKYKWTKEDSVGLAIYAAELCLPNYEKQYKDKSPRLAIEAAKKWLKTGSKKGLSAAESAAWSAWSAEIKKTQAYFKKKEKQNAV